MCWQIGYTSTGLGPNYFTKRHQSTFDEFTHINDSALHAQPYTWLEKGSVSVSYQPTSPESQLMFRFVNRRVRTIQNFMLKIKFQMFRVGRHSSSGGLKLQASSILCKKDYCGPQRLIVWKAELFYMFVLCIAHRGFGFYSDDFGKICFFNLSQMPTWKRDL